MTSNISTYQFCQLIDYLMKDIKHLESETVKARYALSKHLDTPYDVYMQSDILSGLGGRYNEHPAYKKYIEMFYNNQDPMESDDWVNHIVKLSHGNND